MKFDYPLDRIRNQGYNNNAIENAEKGNLFWLSFSLA